MKLRNKLDEFRHHKVLEKHYKLHRSVLEAVVVLYAIIRLGAVIMAIKQESINWFNEIKTKTIVVSRASATDTETGAGNNGTDQENESAESRLLSVEEKIAQTFPECPAVALAIAKAESNLEPSRIGDKHLIYYEGDEVGSFHTVYLLWGGGSGGGKRNSQ